MGDSDDTDGSERPLAAGEGDLLAERRILAPLLARGDVDQGRAIMHKAHQSLAHALTLSTRTEWSAQKAESWVSFFGFQTCMTQPTAGRGLLGSLRAFHAMVDLTDRAKDEGWYNAGCALMLAINDCRCSLNDVVAWRACDLVGITDRGAFVGLLDEMFICHLEANKQETVRSQLLKG